SPRNSTGGGALGSSARRGLNWTTTQRLAQTGPYVATLLPGDNGLAFFDLVPGVPPRTLNPPDRAVLSVMSDGAGRRLLTIERNDGEVESAALEGMSPEAIAALNEIQVNLWDPNDLEKPVRKLDWQPGRTRPPGRPGPAAWPLIAISPDGKTIAVAAL